MNSIFNIEISEIIPKREEVLRHQGFSKGFVVSDKINELLISATELFVSNAEPLGVIAKISNEEFDTIYAGEGNNAIETPLAKIYPQADNLAIFALTMGDSVCRKIERLFESNDFPLGYMLDSVVSLAADKAVKICETYYQHVVLKRSKEFSESVVLAYSPGYCGWHVSGQRKLFQHLKPGDIGISLNESHMMTPLKSVSGVLVAGIKEIHLFDCNFTFCQDCVTYSCRSRIKNLLAL